MKKRVIFMLVLAMVLALPACAGVFGHKHTYADAWSSNENGHWHAPTCGCDEAVEDFVLHTFGEGVVTQPSDGKAGQIAYTCSVCGYVKTEELRLESTIVTMPSVAEGTYYVGQKLETVALIGGEGSVGGRFAWAEPQTELTQNGQYTVNFIPEDNAYATVSAKLSVPALQLNVDVTAGENGTASTVGVAEVTYGGELTVYFTPNIGYKVEDVQIDGVSVGARSSYTFTNIRENHTVYVSFCASEYALEITCAEGDPGAYIIQGNTIYFSGISQDSIYQISGQFVGNIVIDVGEEHRFELEMRGLNIASNSEAPIVILSGEKVTLTAKKGFANSVHDQRQQVDENGYTAAIYSQCDLVIGGKGSLQVVSDHNEGIHTKDDLEVKNLTLNVDCLDNALKGNDSVTLKAGRITLIARQGDGIKTSNSGVSNKGNQRGTVQITGSVLNIHAACDGIDAAYDVVIDDPATVININTDKYSQYSETVEKQPEDDNGLNYIRFTSQYFSYAVKYYNSDTDYQWVVAQYHSTVSGGRNNYYYYSFQELEGYSKIRYYGYTSDQTPGQDADYAFCSDYMTVNTANDTFALSQRGNQLSYSWTNYSTSIQEGPGGPGGMGGHGGPGGMQDGNTDKGDYSTKGIKAANSITIHAGTVQLHTYDDAIHASNDSALENGQTAAGNVTILGGSVAIRTNDDGLHADGDLQISGGIVTISESYEGVEGTHVVISGGEVTVISTDDGINSTVDSGAGIVVSGGYLYIHAGGDGMDANSRDSYNGILFSGGKTVVITASNGNSAIDTERGYKYTGGYVLAITSSGGMSGETLNCQNMSSLGKKAALRLSAGVYLTVSDNAKTVLTLQLPCSVNAVALYLGSTDVEFASASITGAALDQNGVCWSVG